jgi:hypothetical protein
MSFHNPPDFAGSFSHNSIYGAVMKFIAAIFFVLFSFIVAAGQQASSSSSSSTTTSSDPVVEVKRDNLKGGKVTVPPEKARPIPVPNVTTPITIDGRLDEEAWKTAAIFKDFYQTGPGYNTEPSRPTEAYLLYDEKNLYIGFRCWDEKDKVRATVAKRDAVFGEDNVRVWLDTYDDHRRAYVLGFNPLGIQQDGIYTEGQGADFSVDIVMESKGIIEDWGWSVEVKVPFKSLRYVAGKGKNWGFNVARNIDRFNDEFDLWYPDDRDVSGFLIKFGKITGLDDIKYERTLEIVPSITLRETGERVPALEVEQGRFVNLPIKQDIGVTLKYTLSPNVTLDAAINPDFAEIEADAPVVTANQRFPIFFSEKRPFFLEGVEIFQSPIQVFHSRTIVDPDFAAKITGKIGKTSFGFLAASDKAPGNFSQDDRANPRFSEFIDKNALFGIVRVKRDVGKENNIGFFSTWRSFPEQHNLLGGFDGKFKLDPKTVVQFQVLGTTSRKCFFQPDFEPTLFPVQAQRNRDICGGSTFNSYRTGNGFAYYANYDYTKDTYGFFAEIGGRTRDYRADAGFTRRTNTNFAFFGHRVSTKSKPKAKIIRASWFSGYGVDYDFQGRSQGISWNSNVNFSMQKNLFMNFNGGLEYSRIFEEEFGLKRMPSRPDSGAFFGDPERSTHSGWISANINQTVNKRFNYGVFAGTIFNAFDFDFGAGPRFPRVSPAALSGYGQLDPGPGQQYDFGAGVEWKPTDPLRISLEYNKSMLVRKDTHRTAFDSNIFSLRSTYQFTRFIFTRVRVDYDTLSSNIRGQYLFGWTPSPGKAFYVGYNDDINYNGFNPFSGNLEPGFARNSRTFFIRASYLFRKSF